MAQAAFLLNELKIVDQGDHLVLEGCKRCVDGRVVDHVTLTIPAHLRHLFGGLESRAGGEASRPGANRPGTEESPESAFRDN